MSVEVKTTEDVILNSSENVIVELKTAEDVATNSEVLVQAKIDKWTIVGDDIYIGNQVEALPLWYQGVLNNYITNSSDLATSVSDLSNTFQNFETGYTQDIITINNNHDSLVANVETNYVQNATYAAGIQNLEATKITDTEATAIASNVIGAWQIDPLGGGAWFDSKISTYSNDIQSQATSISSLSAQYNGLNVSIQELDSVLVTTTGWAAESSKFITAPDNSITGWSFGDGSNIQSDFTIYAQNFKVSDGTNTANVPFSIETGIPNRIKFDGIVDFTNTNGLGTTTLDGGKLTTNSIWAGGNIQSTNYDWNLGNPPIGFGLFSAGDLDSGQGYNIIGGKIYGAEIHAANIVAQNIINAQAVRNTNLLTGSGSFLIQEITVVVDKPKKIVLQYDSHYDTQFYLAGQFSFSDRFKLNITRNGVDIYNSPIGQINKVILDGVSDNGYSHYYQTSGGSILPSVSKVLPLTHTLVEEVSAGTYTYRVNAIQVDGTGDALTFDYTFRSLVATIIDI